MSHSPIEEGGCVGDEAQARGGEDEPLASAKLAHVLLQHLIECEGHGGVSAVDG